ncbi:DUF6634 family protein [Mesorhizobium sp. SB112]|uniref:DUF6634 family protein n=1 Tax=Mesorhizobium sp. SB112 TaxID=3151853 RepID=UPI003265FD91
MIMFSETMTPELRYDLRSEIEKYEQLVSDLKAFAQEPFKPKEYFLGIEANAPTLDNWKLTVRSAACLVGDVAEHPILGGGKIVTSIVHLISGDLGYARTASRWYRLPRREEVDPDLTN